MLKILSMDGGGIRGLVSAVILQEIERRTGRPIGETFQLIAGTSAGGINAVTMSLWFPAGTLVKFYHDEGPKIFSRSLFRRITSVGNFFGSRYPAEPFEAILEDQLGEVHLCDAYTEVLVPAYDLEGSRPYFFKRHKAREGQDCLLRDVVRATAAAPTYFPAKRMLVGEEERLFVDGGLFANNPATCAYAEAIRLFPGQEYLMVSIGTGRISRLARKLGEADWGYTQWASQLIDTFMDSALDTVDYQMDQCLGERHFRLQPELPGGNDSLDDASPRNLTALTQAAEDFMKGNERFDACCEMLRSS